MPQDKPVDRQSYSYHPKSDDRYLCPCCGYPTLPERAGYDICVLCNWEDDGQDDPHADEVWGGPNGDYSLSEARAHFSHHLIMYEPDKPITRIGGADSSLEHQAKRSMITAFDRIRDQPEQHALDALWQEVYTQEDILHSEVTRKVREHEAAMRLRKADE